MQEQYDAIIVGAGPAGASCAIWLARLGLHPLLVEAADRVGGLERDSPFADDWIAALPGLTGREVADRIAHSVRAAGVSLRVDTRVTRIERVRQGDQAQDFSVELATSAAMVNSTAIAPSSGIETAGSIKRTQACGSPGAPTFVRAQYLVIASGVRARGLDNAALPHEWPGVLVGPGPVVADQDYRGKTVAILGGGDNAFENYDYVRRRGARHVHIHARHVRARRQFVRNSDPADVRLGSYEVDPAARTVNGVAYDLILVFHGWEPQASFADDLGLARDERGFLRTDFQTARTSIAGVYAIGEVARRMHPCVVTSMADGVVAAKAIQHECENRGQ